MKKWLSNPDIQKPAENDDNEDCDENEVKPTDSISNVETNVSGKSSAASACIQAEAERAAALKEKHALEELRRRKERLQLVTEMAASAAKLAELSASGHQAL